MARYYTVSAIVGTVSTFVLVSYSGSDEDENVAIELPEEDPDFPIVRISPDHHEQSIVSLFQNWILNQLDRMIYCKVEATGALFAWWVKR